MTLLETHKVKTIETPIRLQEYGVGIFTVKPTKSGFKKAIKKQLVFVNGKPATTALFIKGGEIIELYQANEKYKHFNLKLNILFEDDFLAVIYKPAGVTVSGNSFATIYNALPKNLTHSSQLDAIRPHPVHRLDYATSGLLLIGKTSSSVKLLSKLFENKKIQKTYYAVTIGKMKQKGAINFLIDDKNSLTNFEVLQTVMSERFKFLNLVKLQPKTGRKHQLRKHLLAIGNPILGDKKYYIDDLILNGKGLYLQAFSLEFTHPFTKEKMFFSTKLPKKYNTIFSSYHYYLNLL